MSSYHNSPDYPNYASSEDERMKQILDHDAHLAQRQRLHDVDMNKTNTKNFVRMASGGSSVSGKSGSSGMSGSTTVAHGNLQNYFHKKNSKVANSESEREDQFDDGWSFASSALSSRLSRFSSSHRSKKSTASSAASSSVASSSASSTDRWVNRNFDDSHSVQSRTASASGNNSTNYLDFPKDDDDADDEHSTTAHEHSTASGIARNGILSFIANNCLPPQLLSSSKIAHKRSSNHRSFNKNNNTNLIYINSTNSNTSKNNKSRSNNILPFLLLSLILYGTISMIVDVYHSIAQSSLLDFKNSQSKKGTSNDEFLTREQDNQRFPGGFGSVDGSSSASYNKENGNYYGGYGGANSIMSSSNTGMANVDANLRGNEKNVKSASSSASFIPGVRSMDVIQSTSQSLSKQQQQQQQPHGGVGGDSLTYAPASDFSNQQQQQQQQQQNVINGIQNINRNYPTLADVPILTEHILSTTFQHALEYNHHNHHQQKQQQNDDRNNNINAPYPNEILFFWYVGGTPGLGPFHKVAEKFQQCFPNVVQAAGMSEEESRRFPNELRILQHQIPLGNARETKNNHHPTSTRKGGKYLNVDLFSPEGVRRAADLEMLFPMQPFPVAYEHEDETMAMAMAVEQQMMEQQRKQMQQYRTMMEQEDANGENAIMASSQVQFMISPFLPEASMGLFTPPSSSSATSQTRDNSAIETNTPPKARIHGVFLPTNMRIGLYYKHYTSTHLNHGYSSFLQFVTSPTSIVVNNYMTRILSGQWEEGSPVTEVHLEIAKNVVSRKVTLWPNRGMEDMQLHWIHWYGWQDGAMGFYQQLLEDVNCGTDGDGGGVRKEDVEETQKLVLGMDCLFPPPEPVVATGENGALDENGQVISNGVEDGGESQQQPEAARSARPKHQPNELEREINKIIAERNTLDQELFSYVVELYNSRVKS